MKFRPLPFLVFFTVLFFSFDEANSLRTLGIKGKVKKITLKGFIGIESDDGKITTGAWTDSSCYWFNENGKMTSAMYYYDNASPKSIVKEVYTYDKEDHLKTHVITYFNSSSDSSFYSYRNGLKTEKISVAKESNIAFSPVKTIYYYKMDQVISEIRFNIKGDTLGELFYSYNNKGKIVKRIEMEPDSTKKMDSLLTITFSYNNAGLLAEKNWNILGHDHFTSYTYNQHGDAISEIKKSGSWSTTYSYEFEYDKTGNWINSIFSYYNVTDQYIGPKKKLYRVTSRLLTYY
jgi:hypothetical protein